MTPGWVQLQCLRWMVTFGDGPEIYRRDSNPSSNRGWPIIRNVTHIMVCLARLRKTHTYPVWGMTTLRQFRSSGPMRAPCSRGLSLGHFMLNVYSVLFLCIPGTLAAPCLTCFGFQPGYPGRPQPPMHIGAGRRSFRRTPSINAAARTVLGRAPQAASFIGSRRV